jgi:hypothetical protein
MQVALDGGTPVSLASIGTLEGPVAVLGSNVYFTSDLGPAQGDGVFSVPSAGGAMTTLALSMYNAFGFGVDATSVYWVTGQGSVVKLTPP